MADMSTKKVSAEVAYSVLEYTVFFKKHILEAWGTPALLISKILSVLGHFGFGAENTEVKTRAEKLSDFAILFQRNPPGLKFSLALEKVVVTAENMDWQGAEQLITTVNAGINAILQAGETEVQSQRLGLGMHLQIKTTPRQKVTEKLVNPVIFQLLDGEVLSQGIILQRKDANILIDASVAYANGLFVRFYRDHPAALPLARIAQVLHMDEKNLFNVLGIEGSL